jgi:hypothetical protein
MAAAELATTTGTIAGLAFGAAGAPALGLVPFGALGDGFGAFGACVFFGAAGLAFGELLASGYFN